MGSLTASAGGGPWRQAEQEDFETFFERRGGREGDTCSETGMVHGSQSVCCGILVLVYIAYPRVPHICGRTFRGVTWMCPQVCVSGWCFLFLGGWGQSNFWQGIGHMQRTHKNFEFPALISTLGIPERYYVNLPSNSRRSFLCALVP